MRRMIVAMLMLAVPTMAGDKPKPNYKVTRLSVEQVAISCVSGGEPTGYKHGDVLIISCR